MIIIPEEQQIQTLSYAVASAKYSIFCFAYNVSAPHTKATPTYKSLWTCLLEQARRGIDCRMILPSQIDSHANGNWEHNSLSELQAAGWKLRRVKTGRLQHSKSWLIDGKRGILTSANLSDCALTNNIEHMTVTEGAKACLPFLDAWLTHWPRSTKAEGLRWHA